MKKPLIVITGPTASGKTSLAVALAKKIGGEVISGDSMQVYKHMDIGTAKVTEDEKKGIPHYMIDEFEPDQECSVAVFQQQVKKYMNKIYNKGNIPIIVGGTGFYIRSITHDIEFEQVVKNEDYRKQLTKEADTFGAEYLHNRLQKVDPESASTIHMNNVQRVIRALEYYMETGKPISKHNTEEKQKQTPYNLIFIALTMDREILYSRINIRVDQMIEEGLISEIESLISKGYSKNLTSMKAIGYKEFFPFFEGELSLNECIEILKRDTRHYAKRQLTWLKHQANPIWIPVDKYNFKTEEILKVILKHIEQSNIIR